MRRRSAPLWARGREEATVVAPAIAAEAAVWLARLHGPDRSREMERDCLAWQAQSVMHRHAFERCTDIWQEVAGVHRGGYEALPATTQHPRATGGAASRRAVLALASIGCACAAGWLLLASATYSTGVGEQRAITLADGSRVTLNTSTRIRVKLTEVARVVVVEHGEALFEVAKDVARPFVVSVSDAQVFATGTAFLVRRPASTEPGGEAFVVTLLEGQVIVQSAGGGAPSHPVTLAPGQRLRVSRAVRSVAAMHADVDQPRLDQLMAWRSGFVLLDDVTLDAAVAEMNRYSTEQIKLIGPQALMALRVSGAFRAGDSKTFARAVAKLHGLVAQERAGGIVLVEP